MTLLDLANFETAADSSVIEKHFLAAAYNHLSFDVGDNDWICEFMDLPKSAELFSDPFNRYAYSCLYEEFTNFSHAPINDITFSTRLKNASSCELRAAEEYVQSIASLPIENDLDTWRFQILPIWKFHRSRRLIKDYLATSLDLVNKSCSQAESKVALTNVLHAAELLDGNDLAQEALHPLLASREILLGPKLINRVLQTRFSGLNSCLGGGIRHPDSADKGRLIVVAGRPGSGKSTWAMNLALDVAMKKCKVLFYTLEMSEKEVCDRMISCMDYLNCIENNARNPLSYAHIIRQARDKDQEERLREMQLDEIARNLIFAKTYDVTPDQVISKIKTEKRKNKDLGLVVIDYLTLLDLDSEKVSSENRALAVGKATRRLKTVALQTGVDILAVCQLNRGVEMRENKRPMLSDLRESGRIEEDADVVIMNFWPYYYDKEADPLLYEYAVVKNRQGATGTCNATFAAQFYAMLDSMSQL